MKKSKRLVVNVMTAKNFPVLKNGITKKLAKEYGITPEEMKATLDNAVDGYLNMNSKMIEPDGTIIRQLCAELGFTDDVIRGALIRLAIGSLPHTDEQKKAVNDGNASNI